MLAQAGQLSADQPSLAQARSSMLAVGLPASLEDAGILCTSEWWYRLMCDGYHRLLYVLAGVEGDGRRQ